MRKLEPSVTLKMALKNDPESKLKGSEKSSAENQDIASATLTSRPNE